MTTTTVRTPADRRPTGPAERAPRRRPAAYSSDRPRRSRLLTVLMLLVLVYFLLPLFWLVVASTKSNADLFSSFGLWFAQSMSLWENIQTVFTTQDGVYLLWMRNTILYAGTSAVGAALLATMAGYAFAKYRFPGGNAIFSGILGSIMVPTTALAIPTYLLFAKADLTNTPWAVILPSLVSPFGVFLMRVYAADAVDDTLIEAARVDGAGELRIFFQVAMRLLVPGMVTVLLFTLVATWNNYFLPLIVLNSPDLYPLTVGLAQWQATAAGGSGSRPLFSSVITGSLISIIPLVIAFLFLQRYWQSGLATGSVKG
ncbi:carbohydrate ABC transporter permease [Cellulomonas fimi]|uniref:Binding-protein-dependent transport systems inner membrane component n=1 Tax=Cellulomonas fimi (strain ATCC 484 / DSM 20113 / JCM 1341 / CCUG 24087 / LMG 16345 / NBRC 15513 / NCIMB 8980 / NCTC 7547 / NRS-133) TaxID=590998 RepID=F4H0P9_CELFA|nr:carbohydrate ABC transporter permease [Cellulomonas fimi]AEE45022.1 binding-protein-dependent transport systems inner membrane component [Cellulomonas fimi ATCC 484]NNH08954.1 carbohydrate ABC transporter permease [Cellulomonas fimi]VEH27997.1 Inner membrane ABC transporter permease protein ycjP [Cellulomonas fimi]